MNVRTQVIKMLPWYTCIIALSMLLCYVCKDTVTVMVEESEVPHRTCIAIDAGHGGIDGGALSFSGIQESELNLEIALKLDDMFQLLGYDTMLLRNEDTSLHTDGDTIAAQKTSDLKHRVQMVNDLSPALMISIHQNTFSDPQYNGAQVFYSENKHSKELSTLLQNNIRYIANPDSHRKPKSAKGIYLMDNILCTGVLVECGFLTNPQEEALLRSDLYQKKLCGILTSTVSMWLSTSTLSENVSNRT